MVKKSEMDRQNDMIDAMDRLFYKVDPLRWKLFFRMKFSSAHDYYLITGERQPNRERTFKKFSFRDIVEYFEELHRELPYLFADR